MIISPTLKVQERDGGLFVDNVRVRTRDATGRLDEDTAEALRIYDKRARLHTCRVCRSRFIGHWHAHGCSPECRKVVAQRALEKHRRPHRVTVTEVSGKTAMLPKPARTTQCEHCRRRFEIRQRERDNAYCSNACRQAAYRARAARPASPSNGTEAAPTQAS